MRCAEPRPFSAINVTPFIDVLPVLLIIFILTLPATRHAVAVDLPTGAGIVAEPIVHKLGIDRSGALS